MLQCDTVTPSCATEPRIFHVPLSQALKKKKKKNTTPLGSNSLSVLFTCATGANTSVPPAISQKHSLRILAPLRVEILVEMGFGENNLPST